MKSRIVTCITSIVLFATLANPVQLTAQITGGGTANFVPKWTGSTTLGNSVMFQTGGKVGIQTTSPSATLTVRGLNGSTGVNGGNALMALQATGGIGAKLPSGTFGSAGTGGSLQLISGNGGSAPFALGGTGGAILITGGTGGVCFAASVGCGHVGGNGGSIMLQPGAGGSAPASGHPGNVILAPTGGNVGIGETSSGHTLEIKVGGTTLADAWTTRSSRRFKTNIQPLIGSLEKVEQLQGVLYERKADGKPDIGVIAEDVNRIVPEVVSRDPETHEVEGVDYSRLVVLLIEAVKSQQAQLRSQEAELQELKKQVEQPTASAIQR